MTWGEVSTWGVSYQPGGEVSTWGVRYQPGGLVINLGRLVIECLADSLSSGDE